MTSEVKVLALGSRPTRLPQLYIEFLTKGRKLQNDSSCTEQEDPLDGRTEIKIGNQVHDLEIFTNIGMEEFLALNGRMIRQCDGFVLMYNTNSRKSFEAMKSYYDQIVIGKDTTELNICVVALTFEGFNDSQENLCIIPKSEGEEFAKAIQANFYDVDSLKDIIFSDIIKRVRCQDTYKQTSYHLKSSPLKKLAVMMRRAKSR